MPHVLSAFPAQEKPGCDHGSSLRSFFITDTVIIFHLFFPYLIGLYTITSQNSHWNVTNLLRASKLLTCRTLDAHIINLTSCWCRKEQGSSRWWVLILPSIIQMFKWSLCTAHHHSWRSCTLSKCLEGKCEFCHSDKYHVWATSFSKVKNKVRELLLIRALNKTQMCLPFCANSRRRRKSTQLMADNYKNTVLLYIVQHIAFTNTKDFSFNFQSSLDNITLSLLAKCVVRYRYVSLRVLSSS